MVCSDTEKNIYGITFTLRSWRRWSKDQSCCVNFVRSVEYILSSFVQNDDKLKVGKFGLSSGALRYLQIMLYNCRHNTRFWYILIRLSFLLQTRYLSESNIQLLNMTKRFLAVPKTHLTLSVRLQDVLQHTNSREDSVLPRLTPAVDYCLICQGQGSRMSWKINYLERRQTFFKLAGSKWLENIFYRKLWTIDYYTFGMIPKHNY